MNVDIFMQGVVAGFIVGVAVGAWGMLSDVFGGRLPPLRELGRELSALGALVAISRSGDRARQQLLEEARRGLGRKEG